MQFVCRYYYNIGRCNVSVTQLLESLLPARSAAEISCIENTEEVKLCEFQAGHDDDRGEMPSEDGDSDEDTGKTSKRRVRCAHQ